MKKTFFNFLYIAFVFLPSFSFASSNYPQGGIRQIQNNSNIGREGNLNDANSLANIFLGLVNWFAWFVALIAVVFGLYAGYLFITSSGDEAKIKKAKDTLVYALIGVVVSILAFSIVAIADLFV